MIDMLLKIGALPNWISPLWAFIQDIRLGPGTSFMVPYGQGWSGRQIEKLLKRRGIQMWGLMVVEDWIIFEVKRRQARYAAYLLNTEGIPFNAGPMPRGNR